MVSRRAFVLGGGVAGLSAAFALRDRGVAVELIEGHRWLGGRAFTLPDRVLREPCDNGPHVMLGCYAALRALLRRLGTESGFVRPASLRLAFRDAHGRASRLRLPPGPAPLWFGAAVLGVRGLGAGGRVRALRGLAAVLRDPPAEWTLADWIAARGQQGAPRRYLWDPMCRAIMNAEAGCVSAAVMIRTLRRAFLGSGRAAAIWIPTRPWSALVGEPALGALREAGVAVTLGARVTRLAVDGDRVRAIELGGGDVREVGARDVVVSALPWHALARVLPDGLLAAGRLAGSPIVSVHFEAGAAVRPPDDPLVALVDGPDGAPGGPFHFVARRPGSGAFALLSGGGAGLEGLSADATIAAARAQFARHFPAAGDLATAPARLTKEARATFVAAPGSDALRPAPGPIPGLAGLVVCGDWTATGLPATLEGAADSGLRAAHHPT